MTFIWLKTAHYYKKGVLAGCHVQYVSLGLWAGRETEGGPPGLADELSCLH